jgi:hypothetical protein
MFVQTWNKYLPVIKLFLKRSLLADQSLDMNSSDFQRAAGGKKVKFTFSIMLIKGKLNRIESATPLAKDLITVLQQDEVTYKFIRQNHLEIDMNSSFQLRIKNITPPAEVSEVTINRPPVMNEEMANDKGDTPVVN